MKRSPLLREQVAYLTQKLYGKSLEQTPLSGQIKRLDHVQHAYKCKPMKVTRLSRLRYLKHRWLTVTAQLQSLLTLSIKSMN